MEQMMETPAGAPRRGWAKRALRALLWAALVVVVLGALVVAVVLWVNRRDEAPSADVHAMEALVAAGRPVEPADDAIAGIAALDALRARAPATEATPGATQRSSTDAYAKRGDALDAAFRACDAPDGECAALLVAAESEMAGWIERERALLEGYRLLLGRRGWYERPPGTVETTHLGSFGAAIEGQRLHHAQVLLDARAGRADAVREALEADLGFWRAGLAGARTLISKMVAVRGIQRNFETGALALARLPAGLANSAVPTGWAIPVTPAERSLHAVLAWEWKLGDNTMRRLHADQSKALRQREPRASPNALFKPQTTANRNAAMMRSVAHAYDAPHVDLRASVRRLNAQIEDETRFPYSIHNPIGRILSAIAAPAVADYGNRLADLEGRRRALMAVVDLHRENAAPSVVGSRLTASALRDPYTGRPFEWDASSSCVRALGLDRTFGRRCLHYAPARAPAHDAPDA